MSGHAHADGIALVGHVGRQRMRFALTDEAGELRADTICTFGADENASVAGTLSKYLDGLAIPRMPARSCIAVAGLARGDTISITNTRWYVSRTGLAAMLMHSPVIVNDFAAEAWGLHAADPRPDEIFNGSPGISLRQPGCYCVIGMTSGLGVAIVSRDENGHAHVLPTEAGHGGFVAGSEEMARVAADMCPGKLPLAAEFVLSAPGLSAIYKAISPARTGADVVRTPEEITRSIGSDPCARRACELLCRAFWSYVGGLIATYGAWDGVFVTGGLARALRPILRLPEMQAIFAGEGKYRRLLEGVPRAIVSLDHAELIGAAEIVRRHRDPAGTLA